MASTPADPDGYGDTTLPVGVQRPSATPRPAEPPPGTLPFTNASVRRVRPIGRGRKVAKIVAVSLVTVVLLGGIGYGMVVGARIIVGG